MFIVYRITNLINYKLYFGYTSKTIDERWKQHCKLSKSGGGCRLHRAIRKYGETCFSISVESTWPTKEQTIDEEIRLIGYWDTFRNKTVGGYNDSIGGELGGWRGNKPHTEETKRKISEAKKGKVVISLKQRSQISATLTGRKRTADAIAKAALATTGKKRTAEQRKNLSAGWTPEIRAKVSNSVKLYLARTKTSLRLNQETSFNPVSIGPLIPV